MSRTQRIVRRAVLPLFCLAASGLASGAGADAKENPSGAARTWVFFADKALPTPAERDRAIADVAKRYDPRAIERRRQRRTRPALFDEADVPVAAAHRAAVESTGASVHVESAWLNAVSVLATPEQVRVIATLPCVSRVEPVRGGRGSPRGHRRVETPASDDFYGLASAQLNQISLPALHGLGFTGAGVRIGVLDTGFRRTHAVFNDPQRPLQMVAEYDFVNGDPNTGPEPQDHPDQHVHGTLILGSLAAYLPNELVAGAYDASYILCKTEDITSETPAEEDNYVAGLEFIEAHGGDIATASLVYSDWYTYSQFNGLTAVTTIAVNIATGNGMICLNAAGNSGHDNDPEIGHLGGAPADAFQVLTIGAVAGDGETAWFSSDGPTADGRLKPELMARGLETMTIDPHGDSGYAAASGTSLATPVAASAVACLVQARPWWTVDQMRAALFAKASEMAAHGQPDPLLIRGHGILNAAESLAGSCYPNCDGSTTAPALNVNDFVCFQQAFAAGLAYANCDGSTAPPVLNVNDFVCFQQLFAGGCP